MIREQENIRRTLARVTSIVLLAQAHTFRGEDVSDMDKTRRDTLTDLEGDFADFLVLVGGVLSLVPSLEVILVLKHRRPSAVSTTAILALVSVVVILAPTVFALVIDITIRVIPSLGGSGEGGDREDREREESSN